jgi:hypothetical protein
MLADRQVASVLPLATGGGIALVVGMTLLPGSAVRLNSSQNGFRWYVVPISGLPGSLEGTVGARNRYTAAAGPSLAAVVAVSMARRDRADPRDIIPPYQVRVQMPQGQVLGLAGYEWLVNLLARAVPISVVVDTDRVREQHIDPAGDGHRVRLTGRLAHTFRAYRQGRRLGAANTDRES